MNHRSFPGRLALIALVAAGTAFAQGTTPASAPATAASAASPEADPYLWLEEVESPRAMDWVRAENAKTLGVLEKDARYEAFHAQALAIAENRDRIPEPHHRVGRLYNFWQDPAHVRGVWRRTTVASYEAGGTPQWETVLDLDALAKAEKANWTWAGSDCAQHKETRCLLQLSDGGEDAHTLREFDTDKRAFVKGGFVLPKGKQEQAWLTLDTLLVSREWTAGEMTTSGYPFVIKRLKRGQPLSAAVEVFRGEKTDVGAGPHAMIDAQGHELVWVQRETSFFESRKFLLGKHGQGPRELGLPHKSDIVAFFDNQVIVHLREVWHAAGADAPEGALVAVDLGEAAAHPDKLKPVVVYAPGPRQAFEECATTKDSLVVASLDNVRGRAALYRRAADGSWSSTPVPLPDNATVHIVDTDDTWPVAYLSVAGFLQPASLWRTSLAEPTPRKLRAVPDLFDNSRDAVEQFEAVSTDGTKVPYFIVHPKGMAMDGSHPTILYAYGGFNQSLSPNYIATAGKLWLEHGGIWVVANIRGGGEFGPAWHEAGLKTKRQVIYDDFAAVAKDLVARGVTSQRRLGIMGGSNGGLLMGVEMTQHPELFNAVDIQVPLLDMDRMEQIAAGSSWIGEYGAQAVPEERAFLHHISPYAQLRADAKYPMPLVWTTTKDDRVGPSHARKFAARLSEQKHPYLYYEVIEGGHAAGANLKESAHTRALEYVYFTRQLMD